ncbi:hypothetical protein [Eubacterium sp.]|jgi:hypothetical protein|uniref:hypothetical protein n=1 Tax=Eubacterium sp. TaxID=142586 RepID=UPI0039946463
MADGKDFDSEFEVIRVRNTGSKNITDAVASKAEEKIAVEKHTPRRAPLELVKRLFLSKKYNNNLVERLSNGDLTIGQMKQIKNAIKNGLSEKQIDSLISCKKDEKAMATIIEIAIMLNKGGS